MSAGLNEVRALGNLGADPELRFTQGGTAVMNARLACSTSYKDKKTGEWQDRTEWMSIVIWGKRAEGLAKVLRKGSRMFVAGHLQTSSYDDKDGNKRYKTEVVADNIILCDGKANDSDSTSGQQRPTTGRKSPARGVSATPAQESDGGAFDPGYDIDNDDLPY